MEFWEDGVMQLRFFEIDLIWFYLSFLLALVCILPNFYDMYIWSNVHKFYNFGKIN